MTSLPIQLPQGSTPLVSVGDTVKRGQPLATCSPSHHASTTPAEPSQAQEVSISLVDGFGEKPAKVSSYLLKSPGESISVGEVIASKKGGLTLKKTQLVSQIQGTILRYERGTGQLIVRLPKNRETIEKKTIADPEEIVSPLDGKVSVCNNEKIVLESEGDGLLGTKGSGAEVIGELDTRFFDAAAKGTTVKGSQIKREIVDKILLVGSIEREALVKADAIGVKGVITTSIDDEDLSYVREKHFGLPVVEVDVEIAKKLQKTKAPQIVLNGREKTIIEAN